MPKRKSNGDGSLRQRPNGSWEYRVVVGTALDGTLIRKSFYDDTKTGAKNKYKEFLKNRTTAIEKVKTVSEWAMHWLEIYKKGKIGYKTYLNYEMYVKRHIIPSLGQLKLDAVRPAHIEKLYASKADLSAAAKRDIHTVLKGIFTTAIDNRLCAADPTKNTRPTPPKRTTVEAFKLSEVKKMLEYAPKDMYGHYLQILLYTGLRVGEFVTLMWSDIDMDSGIITIQRAAAAGPDGEIIKGTKTDRIRRIGINAPLEEILRNLPRTGLYVITDDKGIRLSCGAFYNRYEYIFDRMHKAGVDVPFLSPHKCRHTYATYMLAGGANLRAVQSALGHTTVTTTEIYTHVDTDEIRNNIAKLKY